MERLNKIAQRLVKIADDHSARELSLWIDNDSKLYNDKINTFFANLTRKKAAGKYDAATAPQLFMYLAERAAKSYAKEFGNESEWHQIFDKKTRMQVAKELVQDFEDMYSTGELDQFIPKKYRNKK